MGSIALPANAILRKTAESWRFIYYTDAPKSTLAYVQDMHQNMATPEFRQRVKARQEKEDASFS